MAWFFKFKFLNPLKLNFNGGQFYEKILNFNYLKKWEKVTTKPGTELLLKKTGPHLSCNMHKIGANLYIKWTVAHFSCKKVGHWVGGWMGEWMEGWKEKPG